MGHQRLSSANKTTTVALRALPSVDTLLQALTAQEAAQGDTSAPHARLSQAARTALRTARNAILSGQRVPTDLASLMVSARAYLAQARQVAPRPVINATGVIINTNLGRAPMSEAALHAIAAAAAGYSALEYDLEHGERGSRQTPVRALLRDLVGAEDALVVNNNAAALLVALSALASGREVIVSRGELVEIGGGFRIPDVLRQSGARLVETGATNRTHPDDFAAAITPETALLLSVHPSNYRIVGFTSAPSVQELAVIASQRQLPLIHDLGSGALLHTEQWGLAHEPMPQESLSAGADLVCFSGDKLLGGPQAGILAGKADLIARIERHPLMRAVRVDKLTLAALNATLWAYREGTAIEEIPVWQMIATPAPLLKTRAEQWTQSLRQAGVNAGVREGLSTIGGGAMPGETLPTWHCTITAEDLTPRLDDLPGDPVAVLAARLRTSHTPVIARILRDQLLLDPRTVLPGQDPLLLQLVIAACAKG